MTGIDTCDIAQLMAEYLDEPLSDEQQFNVRYQLLNIVEGMAYSLFKSSLNGNDYAKAQLETLVKESAAAGISITALIRRRIKHIDWMVAHGF